VTTVNASRKIVVGCTSVLSALVLAYAATPWHRASGGLPTFLASVVAVSGLSLGLALRAQRRDSVGSTGRRR